jgi:hypothetical protein
MDEMSLSEAMAKLAEYGVRKPLAASVRQVSVKKSSAQVETLGRPQVVSPISGGLKPKRKRPYRLMGRFSKEEKERVEDRAYAALVSVNEFIRLSTLGANYASSLDPELRQRFIAVHKELCRQGDKLSQIEKLLNFDPTSPEQANSTLAIMGRSLLAAHWAVREALAAASTEPYE